MLLQFSPWEVLKKRFVLYVRSLCYLCFGFSSIFYLQCYLRRILGAHGNFIDTWNLVYNHIIIVLVQPIAASIGCLNIMLEVESRQKEIFLFVLPRIIITAWNFLKRRKIITHTLPFGENLLFGLGLGVVLDFMRKESPEIKSAIKSSLMFLTGRT